MSVAEVKCCVYCDHQQIYYIKAENNVFAVKYLVDNAAYIAYENCPLKSKASAGSGAAFKGFIDINRPCKTKTYKHACFKNTHKR